MNKHGTNRSPTANNLIRPRVTRTRLAVVAVLVLAATSCHTSPAAEDAAGASSKVNSHAQAKTAAEQSEFSGDFRPIYPDNIVGVGSAYYVREFKGVLVRFQTIMFDKYSLAMFMELLAKQPSMDWAHNVLDIGTGTGTLGFASLAFGAQHVVATDLDPLAVDNARYNARILGFSKRFEVRQVPASDPGAWSVVGDDERFDLVTVDPPQGYTKNQTRPFPELSDDTNHHEKEYFYSQDLGGKLLVSLMSSLDRHLTPEGKAWIILKTPPAKLLLRELGRKHGFRVTPIYSAAQSAQAHAHTRRLYSVGDLDFSKQKEIFEVVKADHRHRSE